MKSTTGLLLLCFFVGCATEKTEELPEHLAAVENLTVYPANPASAAEIELVKEVSFGETDEVFFGRIIETIAVDPAGRVFIADLTENKIHIYDSNGSYLQSLGREGQGPGEFEAIMDLNIHDEQIHVLDYNHFKISVFDLNTFEHIRDHDISLPADPETQPSWMSWARDMGLFYRAATFYVRADNTYLLLFSDNAVASPHNIEGRTYEASVYDPLAGGFTEHDLLSFDWSGQVLAHEEGDLFLFRVPYKRSSLFDFSNGQFVHGWSEEMVFRYYDENGEYQWAIYYPYSNASLNMDDLFRYYYEDPGDQVTRAIQSDEHPETWPAFTSLILDDENRLWVSTISDDLEMVDWWVLGESGEFLAAFSWPRNRDLKQVANGYAYTIERDLETDLKEVVRYRIDLGM